MRCEFKLLNSLEKVFFEEITNFKEHTSGSMLKNEIYSFQLAGWGEGRNLEQKMECRIQVESELEPYIQVKQIGYVPSLFPIGRVGADDDYMTKTPGLFPDPLHTVKNGIIEIAANQPRVLWITIEPKGEKVGIYPVIFKIFDACGELMGEACFTIEIIDAELPKLDICNTGWFHGDCIAKLHNVEIMSEEYFAIVEKYIAVYAKFGHNMILTPIFTPPLDTAVGGERPTNQLVEVALDDGQYTFGFDKLKRWIDLCHKYGIKYFEMSHLFTQWGAKHAPKIMATVEGNYQKIFGWETDALSEEYNIFLNTFLSQLVSFLEIEGILEYCFFHVSDEPEEQHEQQYRAAKDILRSYVKETQMIDALSAYSFYEKGIVSKPVVSVDHIHTYMEHGANDLWTYYCRGQIKDVANRFMAMPSYRNRILGYQLYKYEIKGFLQWGFNFWFSRNSASVINPYTETAAGGEFPSGDAFVVYPLDEDGEVVCSLRLYVFNEGFQDMRALKLLESLSDRETVIGLLEEVEGFKSYPRNSQYIIQVRELINEKIKSAK